MKKTLVVFLMGVLVGLAIPLALRDSTPETAPYPRYVQRVIGVAGDRIEIRDGVVIQFRSH